jgi:quercetin dioxygenase-like cupin family protein
VWKARADETNGAFAVFEDHLTRGKVTPLHLHPHNDDSFYVVEGEIVFHIDGEEHVIGAGGFATALRGTPHAFKVTSETAVLLCIQTPGNEAFYVEGSDLMPDGEEPSGHVDVPRLQATAQRNPDSVQFLGPPPFGPPAG